MRYVRKTVAKLQKSRLLINNSKKKTNKEETRIYSVYQFYVWNVMVIDYIVILFKKCVLKIGIINKDIKKQTFYIWNLKISFKSYYCSISDITIRFCLFGIDIQK